MTDLDHAEAAQRYLKDAVRELEAVSYPYRGEALETLAVLAKVDRRVAALRAVAVAQ